MKKITFLFLIFTISVTAQFSKTHYIPPLSGSNSVSAQDQFLYISTYSTTPVNFKIYQLGGNIIVGTVSRNTPYVHDIGFGTDTQLHANKNAINLILNNKGYIIEAEDMISVTARVLAGNYNQAGALVSKGLASLGKRFRIGAFTNTQAPSYGLSHLTFISVLATENNTTVSFSDIKPGVILINNTGVGNTPAPVVLNSGESFILGVEGPTSANKDGLIGALVTSDKPIAINCGSYGGTNGEMSNLDLGFDQIVSAERTGKEFIFIKNVGLDNVEKVLLVADSDNTDIFINGNTTPIFTLNAGQYAALNGSNFTANNNLFVRTSKNVFAYQSIGDYNVSPPSNTPNQANQEMFFVPPLSCQTPKMIDNIPFIELIGNRVFTGRVTMVTKTGSALNFIIDNVNYTLATLPPSVSVIGPLTVTGNTDYETYIINGLSGNVSVFSTGELYLASYGSNSAATFGGFYSGFTFKPEITFTKLDLTQSNCIPNVKLQVSSLSGFDTFQWYFNDVIIPGATGNFYTPTQPGYYNVVSTISSCGTDLSSDKIPVSSCPTDRDNDSVNDNIDLDNDNDGITNCTESYGNQNLNLSNTNAGTIAIENYSNNFTGSATFSGTGIPPSTPITGYSDGNFSTEAAIGKSNSTSYALNFTQPVSLSLEYTSGAPISNLLTTETELIISSPVNKTLTILNPDNQLLVDTNYDGIYESDVTEFSSFEIRIRLNSNIPLAAGTGTFKINGFLINSLTVTNKNLSDSNSSKVSLKLTATCVPKDSDNDGIADQWDIDSDNDGIPDNIEAMGANFVAFSNTDTNRDGIDNAYGNGLTPVDTDADGVPNYLDLDSDNDGIYDLTESGSNAIDANNNGVVDGNPASFGTNGLSNSLETAPNNGILNYTVRDTDADGLYNAIELDSDNDFCFDVIEAGFTDANNDGLLGNTAPPTVNANGLVTSGIGYTTPHINYITAAPIIINTQPVDKAVCELQNITFTINTNTVNGYQWQVSIDGGNNWNNIINNATYSGATTTSLAVSNASPSMNGFKYRVILSKNGNTCGLISSITTLTVYSLPTITTPVTLVQCDDDTDGISSFNLNEKNSFISSNYLNEIFTFYTSQAGADTANTAFLIANPTAYTTSNTTVWVRVVNTNGCFRIAQLNLIVSATQLPASFQRKFYVCDDYVDAANDNRDGIATFNFSSVTTAIQAILPVSGNYSIKYYRNAADAQAETDASGNSLAITNISNYRNIGYPNQQQIWVRVDSNVDNACYGMGPHITLTVEALPFVNPVNSNNVIRHCDDNHDGIYGFDTSGIHTSVLNGQNNVTVTYYKQNGTQLQSPLPNPLNINGTETITIRVTNNNTMVASGPCYDEKTLTFIVDDLPEAFPIPTNLTTVCDDEIDPVMQNGIYSFNTSNFQSTILGGQTGMIVKYFDANGNPLSSPLPNPFTTGTQNVTVVIENPINTTCPVSAIIPFVVKPTPKIDLEDHILICLPDTQATLNAGIVDGTVTSNYTYQWYYNGTAIPGGTNPTLTISTDGTYTVDVSNSNNCTKTRTITVVGSEIAHLQNINIVDLADINTVLVSVTGAGDYVYALDDINGPYQVNNLFYNVPMGIHEVYIKDSNGCGIVGPIKIHVLGIPKFFTPNGDGFNDYWNVKGVSVEFNSKTTIYIFNRYGKLLKQIAATGLGWDGTFNGQQMPSDDYWYRIEFEDGRSAKGHFALKR